MVSKFGTLVLKMETADWKEMEKCIIKKAELQENIESCKKQLEELKIHKKTIPAHLTMSELPEEARFSSLSYEKKHIMDTVKMIAYRTKSWIIYVMN